MIIWLNPGDFKLSVASYKKFRDFFERVGMKRSEEPRILAPKPAKFAPPKLSRHHKLIFL